MTENERQRAIAFMRQLDDGACDRRERFSGGVATLTDGLPRVMNLNLLRVEQLAERLPVAELQAEAERLSGEADRICAGLGHRRIVAYDEEIGTRLALGFEPRPGWTTERVVLMAQHRPVDRDVDTSFVREVDEAELQPARERFFRSGGADDELVAQELEAARRLAGLGEVWGFAAVVAGEVASYCELYADGSGTAQIRGVATLAEHRGGGLARATVSQALTKSRALGHELTFLRAVHDDWPKNLYGKLGFDAIGTMYRFTRLQSERLPSAEERA
jgi:GNAT superfamily N-acetyltransferase